MSMGSEYDTPEHLKLDRRDTYADAAIGAVILHQWVTPRGVVEIAARPEQSIAADAVRDGQYMGTMSAEEARLAADQLAAQLEASF
jgi:hypothetical protein